MRCRAAVAFTFVACAPMQSAQREHIAPVPAQEAGPLAQAPRSCSELLALAKDAFLSSADFARKVQCEAEAAPRRIEEEKEHEREVNKAKVTEDLKLCSTLRDRIDACKTFDAEARADLMGNAVRLELMPNDDAVAKALACSYHAQDIAARCERIATETWIDELSSGRGKHGTRPAKYVALTRGFFRKALKDPYSARYGRVTRPRKEYVIVSETEREALLGWTVCATVNGKNGFGAYAGNSVFWFFIVEGTIVDAKDIAEDGEVEVGRPVNCHDGP